MAATFEIDNQTSRLVSTIFGINDGSRTNSFNTEVPPHTFTSFPVDQVSAGVSDTYVFSSTEGTLLARCAAELDPVVPLATVALTITETGTRVSCSVRLIAEVPPPTTCEDCFTSVARDIGCPSFKRIYFFCPSAKETGCLVPRSMCVR